MIILTKKVYLITLQKSPSLTSLTSTYEKSNLFSNLFISFFVGTPNSTPYRKLNQTLLSVSKSQCSVAQYMNNELFQLN